MLKERKKKKRTHFPSEEIALPAPHAVHEIININKILRERERERERKIKSVAACLSSYRSAYNYKTVKKEKKERKKILENGNKSVFGSGLTGSTCNVEVWGSATTSHGKVLADLQKTHTHKNVFLFPQLCPREPPSEPAVGKMIERK